MGRLTLSFIDKSGETASVGLPIPDLTVANIESYSSGGIASDAFNDLNDFIDVLTLLNPTGHTLTSKIVQIPPVRPADANAQRETGLLVLMADTNGHKSRFVIPGLDRELVAQEGTDEVPLTGIIQVEELITAVEAYCIDPITGLAVTVYGMRMVGRNN
jgi:hypothetical protein